MLQCFWCTEDAAAAAAPLPVKWKTSLAVTKQYKRARRPHSTFFPAFLRQGERPKDEA